MAETFLAHLSTGYSPALEYRAGGTIIGGDWQGHEKAWELMGPDRPSFNDFQARWAGTIRMGVIQVEPITPTLFFVELERVAWYGDHWAVSYWNGELETGKSGPDWHVRRFRVCTESLARPNIIGHTNWHQDDLALASVMGGVREPEVLERRYERRTVRLRLRNKQTGEVKAFRMARVVEGAWRILEPRRWPICGREEE